METLRHIVNRLNEADYRMLLANVATDKHSKPYIVLETIRHKAVSDAEMIKILEINPSTYYTLKSRLNSKVAAILSKNTDNPISALMQEVSRVPASLYGTNKQVAIRSLKELEKQLLEYDLSNELIIVYHSLARLNMYNEEYKHYERLYNRFVAFSLASAKGENIYYNFTKSISQYQLTNSADELAKIENSLQELANINELYDSHRLFVFFNIMQIYYLLITGKSIEGLVQKEMEIDKNLEDMRAIFAKYPMDTFYNTIKFIVEALHFEYYLKINNLVRARHYYKLVIANIGEYASHPIMNFHIVQFLNAKICLSLASHDEKILKEKNEAIFKILYVDSEEEYNYIYYYRYQAVVKFYDGDYHGAAGILNSLRDTINLKSYWLVEIDLKLFQAFQYALLKEDILCRQLIGNIERKLRPKKTEYKNIKVFIKLIKASMLSEGIEKITSLWELFSQKNMGNEAVLSYLQIDKKILKKLIRK